MQKLLLLIACLCLLVACEKTSIEITPAATVERVAAVPASTSFFLQQTSVPSTPVSPDATTPVLDPGPYFTPQRDLPSIPPAEFIPPEKVGNFTRSRVRGSCQENPGQSSEYLNEANQMIYLTCQYTNRANAAKNYISTLPQIFKADPVQMKLQGEKSFALLPSGNGFVYAWTQGAWYFTARSLNGRETLDDFMQNFPY